MTRLSSSFSCASALLACALLAAPARAQPCCAGASALTPARLTLHEDWLLAAQLRPQLFHGSFDGQRAFQPPAPGSLELGVEETALAAARLFTHAQVALAVPFRQTFRAASGLSEVGGGLGDLSLSGRYDFTLAGESSVMPGLAVLAGISLPTGRAPEAARLPLGTDASGTGAFLFSLGVGVEQTFGSWFASGSLVLSQATPRSVGGLTSLQGLGLSALLSAGYGFQSEAALALTAGYADSRDALVDGAAVPDSGRAHFQIGLSGALPLNEEWRLQGSVFDILPLNGLGRNESAGLGLSIVLVRSWT